MTKEELAVFLLNLEDDCNGDKLDFTELIVALDDWMVTSGEYDNFGKFYQDYKDKLND